jgi:NAD(P)H-hydrate epimerase
VKLVTADQMRRIDQLSAEAGVGTDVLMENAGLAVAQESWMALGTLEERHILVLAGPGNNGGDGLVAARYLHEWGATVQVYLLKARSEDDANYRRLLEAGVPLTCAEDDAGLAKLDAALAEADLVVDALLGTGAARPIGGRLAEVLSRLATARARTRPPILLAVDVPTGLNSDTGAADPLTVAADHTVTLGYSKVGLHTYPGARYAGRVQVVDIGIPPALAADLPYELMTASSVRALLPARPPDANKGTFGRVLVVAGSENYVGAAHLAAAGAYRVGAGLVTLACPRSLHPVIASALMEATYLPLPEEEGGLARRAADFVLRAVEGYEVLLVGCGLGQRGATQSFVRALLFSLAGEPPPTVVVDADGLNALARTPGWWREMKAPAIVTPHPGEMSRLSGRPIPEIQADRLGCAVDCAREWGKTVVLKGAHTVVAAPDGRAGLSPFANPALASGGTGDVLAGALAGFLAQGLSPFEAAICGVYVHAAAGEDAQREMGDAGLVASDLLPLLPRAIKTLISPEPTLPPL